MMWNENFLLGYQFRRNYLDIVDLTKKNFSFVNVGNLSSVSYLKRIYIN